MLAHFHHIMSFPATLAKKPGPKHSSDQSCALSQMNLRLTATKLDHEVLVMSRFRVSIKVTLGLAPFTIRSLIWFEMLARRPAVLCWVKFHRNSAGFLCSRLLLLFLQFITEVKIYSILWLNFLEHYYTNSPKAPAQYTAMKFTMN